jgi:hypothetical protein
MAEPQPIRPQVRMFTVDLTELRPGTLSFGDLIDVADATGLDPTAFEAIVSSGKGVDRLRLLCAFAWLAARRDEPALTYQDVLAGQVQVTGQRDRSRPARTRVARASSRR